MTKLQCAIRYIGTKKLGEYIFFIHCKFRYEIDPWRVVRVHLPNFQITYASKLFLRLKRPVLAVRPLLMLAASFCGFSVLFSNFVLSSNWIAVDMVWTYYEPRLTMGGGLFIYARRSCLADPILSVSVSFSWHLPNRLMNCIPDCFCLTRDRAWPRICALIGLCKQFFSFSEKRTKSLDHVTR